MFFEELFLSTPLTFISTYAILQVYSIKGLNKRLLKVIHRSMYDPIYYKDFSLDERIIDMYQRGLSIPDISELTKMDKRYVCNMVGFLKVIHS